MILEDIYYIGQTVAVFALVASLIFVGFQMREQNKQSRLEAVRQLGELFDAWWEITAKEEHLGKNFASTGRGGRASVDESSRAQFAATIQRILRRWEIVYFYHAEGRLKPELWRSNEKALAPMAASKGFRDYWAIRRGWYSAEFAHYIDGVMEKTPPDEAFIGVGGERIMTGANASGDNASEAN